MQQNDEYLKGVMIWINIAFVLFLFIFNGYQDSISDNILKGNVTYYAFCCVLLVLYLFIIIRYLKEKFTYVYFNEDRLFIKKFLGKNIFLSKGEISEIGLGYSKYNYFEDFCNIFPEFIYLSNRKLECQERYNLRNYMKKNKKIIVVRYTSSNLEKFIQNGYGASISKILEDYSNHKEEV